jgi:hypothetical protein
VKATETGAPLPELENLWDLHHGFFEFTFRKSELTMICGQPAAWKSGLSVWLIAQWAKKHGLTALYVSGDMAQHTATARLTAAVSGDTTRMVQEGRERGYEDDYMDQLADVRVQFMFNSNPTLEDIWCEIDAWVEMWDAYPDIIVLDNLLDIVPGGGDNEFSGYKSVLLDAKTMRQQTGAAVFILHHMSEGASDPEKPAPRKAIMGKVAQTPENILSIAKSGDKFFVSVVKHRSGPDDPTAQRFETFLIHPDRNQLERYFNMSAPPVVTWQRPGEDDE